MPPLTSIDLLGLVAGAMTTVSFVPQAVKTLRTRQTRDISLSMWLLFCCGVGVWIVYGLLVPAWPVVAANIPTLILAGVILAVKIANLKRE
ncbi:SemiSWEET transporter [Magnetospirillum fulvum]|jgi:MtN3 and saliva related transmembrane protein|uniref:MtN3 and saliva related transmembrane protein n=1 Tax=Magnetospirillum fulvum TaxID=1082 RepID=A0A1H6H8K2_MAGFU|nr:SemiSWEET transporter [Magnetospirillum fulvum]SEH30614.1 MtN3 and saliva related transmembrane protein [Magnetospirillum fulvum]